MSHGRHSKRAARRSSMLSSSSSSSSTTSVRSVSSSPAPNFGSIQNLVQKVFRSSRITIQKVERIQGRLHQVYVSQLGDGSVLVLRCPPSYTTRFLQHERHSLETERKALETLHEFTHLPIPQVLKYDNRGGSFGSPYLLTSYLPGRRLSELSPHLSSNEKNAIDRTLGAAVRSLTNLSATQFGLTHRVFEQKGSKYWREAFLGLLESVLRDAEGMLVTMPYDSIRGWVTQRSTVLDDVGEPRLVALYVCEPDNVLIDEQTKQVTGLLGFSDVIWGDPLMCGGVEGGSASFFQGFGEVPERSRSMRTRQLMYTVYRSAVQIVAHHYRPHSGLDELQARRSLTSALNSLANL